VNARWPFSDLFERLDGRDEREFLPAALEVIETPASPVGRLLGLLIILFFCVALAWSILGRVDIIATAPGRLLPTGGVKLIQPAEEGVVRAILVHDGQAVRRDQILIQLDDTPASADRDRLNVDLIQAKLDVARLKALSQALASGRPPQFAPPPGAPADLVAQAKAALQAQADQQAAKLADLSEQIQQKSAEEAEDEAQSRQISASIPLLAEKEQIHHDLSAQGYGTSLAYLDAQQQLSDARHGVDVESQRAAQARAARAALERERAEARAEFAAGILADLRKAEAQANEQGQDLLKAQDKANQTDLRAPADGVVEQLAAHTPGGVVTPAETLMIVVPDNQPLTIEARLSDRDVGFVHAGQPVKVKVETFNFTRYGLIDGLVTDVSRDVVDSGERQAGDTPAPPGGSPPRPSEPTYIARIALSRSSMMIDGRSEPLAPGMAITAEIKTGERSIISYLLSPLARRTSESLRER
jgi:hemolysin D